MNKYLKGAICAAVTAFAAAGCNNFLKGGDLTHDPNNPTTASSQQYFAGVQSNLWELQTSDLARFTSLWMQQVFGAARQAQGIQNFSGVTEGTFDGQFAAVYQGGGMLDLRKIDAQSEAVNDSIFLGVSYVLEAWLVGTAADIWGDVPYSQADSLAIYPQPVLDPQQSVYTAVQDRLSQGITALASGVGAGPGSFDLVYGGDPDSWIALAHTLKARFYLHTAETVGNAAYASALAEANQGISSNAGDYIANFSGTQAGESNPWWQFVDLNGTTGRAGDITGQPSHLDSLLASTADPRRAEYYNAGDDTRSGFSAFRDDPGYPQPFVTYNENLLIKAEAEFETGATGPALTDLNLERAAWGTATPWHHAITLAPVGAVTLAAIMNEKYITLFQNVETWNDYKRTCIPALTPTAGGVNGVIPGRLLYPVGERQTNSNVPAVNAQPPRNWNDPNACPAP